MLPFIRTPDDWSAVAAAVARSLAAQHIVYVEASISPTDFRRHGLALADIALAVRRGLDEVSGTQVNLLVDLVRDTEALTLAAWSTWSATGGHAATRPQMREWWAILDSNQ